MMTDAIQIIALIVVSVHIILLMFSIMFLILMYYSRNLIDTESNVGTESITYSEDA